MNEGSQSDDGIVLLYISDMHFGTKDIRGEVLNISTKLIEAACEREDA